MIDRTIFFDKVRSKPFGGKLDQGQVDGMNYILDQWEHTRDGQDLRWLSYALATTYHECSAKMQPIEEYGKGSGQSYGKPDPQTGKTYYGRGYVQLTWKDNYAKMTPVVAAVFPNDGVDLVWKPEQALNAPYAAIIMFDGMERGMFRSPNTLAKWFSSTTDDPYQAREIINGDKHIVPSWSNGVSIGNLIKGYHLNFLDALKTAYVESQPEPPPTAEIKTKIFETDQAKVTVSVEKKPDVT